MKKLLSLLVSFGALCFATFAFAQDLWWVSVRFCNNDEETKNLNLILESGVEWEICIDFFNESSEDVTIKYGFVDGVVTADEYKNKACENEWTVEKFGQYVSQVTDTISIPALTSVRQKATITFPAWLSWIVNWCLTYYVWGANVENSDSMFNVLVRKAQFIDVSVDWNFKRNLQLANTNPLKYVYDKATKSYNIELSLLNKWNISEFVTVAWTISNKFWFNVDVVSDEQRILPDDVETIVFNVCRLPWYKMRYNVDLSVISNPQFDFSLDFVPDELEGPMEIALSLSVFVFPWILVYMFIGLVVLVILIRWLSKHLKFK